MLIWKRARSGSATKPPPSKNRPATLRTLPTLWKQILWRESCACSLRETLITIWTAGYASPSGFIKDFQSKLLFLTINSSFIFRDIGISVLCQSSLGTFLVLNSSSLLVRGIEHVHEYQLVKENKIGWYIKVKFQTAINEDNFDFRALRALFLIFWCWWRTTNLTATSCLFYSIPRRFPPPKRSLLYIF